MENATLEKLEFDQIRVMLASHCACALGKKLARSVTPSTNPKLIGEWLDQVRDLQLVVEQYKMPPFGGIYDIRDYVRATAFPTPIEAEAFAKIAETLGATAHLCEWFLKVGDDTPSLLHLGKRIEDLSSIGLRISEAIDSRGTVRDDASARLANIRRTIEQTRDQIRAVFDRILRQSSLTKMLQYSGSTFHGDRMVLPLKAEYRGRIRGIVHRSSGTGATMFVEPDESVQLNNSIVHLRDQETKEITRILLELSQMVYAESRPIVSTLHAIGILDFIAAKCHYAKKRDCVCPELDEHGILDLHDARHPLLLELFADEASDDRPERQVVPIDVRLGDDFDVLVITGPNTGGKTVTLKTVGLCSLMAQCGIPIPVGEGSRVPVYRQVFMDIGDEQSLQQSLSTFSSHMATLLNILKRSGTGTLVLIDELGAGTDPDDGAAIGRAIVTELLRLDAKAIVTTHLSSLKAVAYTTPRVDNAAVEFDPQSLNPTFRLHLGEPGNSNALIIAKRLGMPERIIKLARSYLDGATRALSKAIAGTLESRRQAEHARRDAREAALDARREQKRLEQDRAELELEKNAYAQWTNWVNTLQPGDEVYLKTLKRTGKVVRMQLQRQRVLVTTGAIEIEVPITDIDEPPSDDGP